MSDGNYHPLFELRDGETADEFPPKEVHLIRVFRLTQNGERGELLLKCSGDRLTDESQIQESFGGGWYELEARHVGQIIRKEKIRLPGPPKDGTYATAAPSSLAAPLAAPVVGGASSSPSSNDGMFALMLQMMDRNAAAREQASREQMQMLLAMMQNNQQVLVAAMSGAQHSSGSMNSLMGSVLTRAMDRPPAPSLDVDAVTKLLDVAKKLAPSSDNDSLTSMISNFVGGLVGAQQMAAAQQQQAAPPPTVVVDAQPVHEHPNGAPQG